MIPRHSCLLADESMLQYADDVVSGAYKKMSRRTSGRRALRFFLIKKPNILAGSFLKVEIGTQEMDKKNLNDENQKRIMVRHGTWL